MLACGNKSSQILVEVSYLGIGLVADVKNASVVVEHFLHCFHQEELLC